ncbi:histidine phosphatase family protein [Aeribacillus pallidus]|nr:histidine phosphatase family protein [Aeribacillus pallidus]
MDDAVVVTLIRHGLTEANMQKRYIGWTDEPLSHEGKKALQSLAFPSEPDLLFTSDLRRAAETARIIYPNKPYAVLKELREINFGEWEMKCYQELKEDDRYRNWLREFWRFPPPNGEAYEVFSKRVKKGWEKIIKHFSSMEVVHIAVITNGGVIRELLYRYSFSRKSYLEWQIKHGAFYCLTGKRSDVRRGKRCMWLSGEPSTGKENG